jgi:hypothetical protein
VAPIDSPAPPRARLFARLPPACRLGALLALLAVSGAAGLLILAIGLAVPALGAAGTWWALSHRGAQAPDIALRGARAEALHVLTARRVTVDSDVASIPVAVDGEAPHLATPVTCAVRPRALRVLVPRHRTGAPAAVPPLDRREILSLALGRRRPGRQP